jgi:hypothetical protein
LATNCAETPARRIFGRDEDFHEGATKNNVAPALQVTQTGGKATVHGLAIARHPVQSAFTGTRRQVPCDNQIPGIHFRWHEVC